VKRCWTDRQSGDFKLDYIVNAAPDGTFKSLHGEPEVQGNCAVVRKQVCPREVLGFFDVPEQNMRECAHQLESLRAAVWY
jgi:hypothetical protein